FQVTWRDERSRVASLLAMTTGMRMGEVLALRLCDLGENRLTAATCMVIILHVGVAEKFGMSRFSGGGISCSSGQKPNPIKKPRNPRNDSSYQSNVLCIFFVNKELHLLGHRITSINTTFTTLLRAFNEQILYLYTFEYTVFF
ncbi:MAG TPA: hypothetical protein VJ861_00795, partial [Treponemataceae bacterium]|nr:hypothetical protein [Treponemataceae bacterium]